MDSKHSTHSMHTTHVCMHVSIRLSTYPLPLLCGGSCHVMRQLACLIMYAREHVCTRAGRGKRKWAVSTSRILPDEEEIVEGIDVRVLKGPFTKDAEWVLEPGAVASLICCRLSFAVASHLLWPLICSCLPCAVACFISCCLSCPLLWCLS